MTPTTPFDDQAEFYDSQFTRTMTGVAQRNIVREFLRGRIFRGMEILEVNCGSGEDAIFLSELGCRVTATDASQKMIEVCHTKIQSYPGPLSPDFKQAAIGNLDSVTGGKMYDLIFSDFSGLNCLNPAELKDSAVTFNACLKPGGRLIIVVFSTKCLWERIYFLMKGKRKEMSRRMTKEPVSVKMMGAGMDIYYFSPKEIRELFNGFFRVTTVKPVGLFIPPTYLDGFFEGRKNLFRMLAFADKLAGSFSFLSNLADHYLIEFRKV